MQRAPRWKINLSASVMKTYSASKIKNDRKVIIGHQSRSSAGSKPARPGLFSILQNSPKM